MRKLADARETREEKQRHTLRSFAIVIIFYARTHTRKQQQKAAIFTSEMLCARVRISARSARSDRSLALLAYK